MNVHQLQMTYNAGEDRILFRTTFMDSAGRLQEIRAWFTRRITRNLWPHIVKALESQVTLDKPQAAHAKTELVGMAHEESIAGFTAAGSFAAPFQHEAQSFPLGETPMLVFTARFTLQANQPLRINFAPAEGHGFEIAFPPPLLHGFCKLLQDAVRAAQWDLALALPGAIRPSMSARVLN